MNSNSTVSKENFDAAPGLRPWSPIMLLRWTCLALAIFLAGRLYCNQIDHRVTELLKMQADARYVQVFGQIACATNASNKTLVKDCNPKGYDDLVEALGSSSVISHANVLLLVAANHRRSAADRLRITKLPDASQDYYTISSNTLAKVQKHGINPYFADLFAY